MKTLVCRIQDADGRGPYKPGFSHNWSERETGSLPVHMAFPDVIERARVIVANNGGAVGCAFRSKEQAAKWFSPSEIITLCGYGYSLCWIEIDEVLAENSDQLVVWSKMPFAAGVIRKGWYNAVSVTPLIPPPAPFTQPIECLLADEDTR